MVIEGNERSADRLKDGEPVMESLSLSLSPGPLILCLSVSDAFCPSEQLFAVNLYSCFLGLLACRQGGLEGDFKKSYSLFLSLF
jgi:hypothetical protein